MSKEKLKIIDAKKGKRGCPKSYTKEQVLEAIKGSGAVISVIFKRLQCTWITAYKYCMRWEETRRALQDEQEAILDMSESVLYKSIQGGNTQDAKWLLATKGKARGFVERQEIAGVSNQPIIIKYDGMFKNV